MRQPGDEWHAVDAVYECRACRETFAHRLAGGAIPPLGHRLWHACCARMAGVGELIAVVDADDEEEGQDDAES